VFTIATGAWRAQTIAVHPAPDLTVDTHRTARYGW
jgi:hypothetical protein